MLGVEPCNQWEGICSFCAKDVIHHQQVPCDHVLPTRSWLVVTPYQQGHDWRAENCVTVFHTTTFYILYLPLAARTSSQNKGPADRFMEPSGIPSTLVTGMHWPYETDRQRWRQRDTQKQRQGRDSETDRQRQGGRQRGGKEGGRGEREREREREIQTERQRQRDEGKRDEEQREEGKREREVRKRQTDSLAETETQNWRYSGSSRRYLWWSLIWIHCCHTTGFMAQSLHMRLVTVTATTRNRQTAKYMYIRRLYYALNGPSWTFIEDCQWLSFAKWGKTRVVLCQLPWSSVFVCFCLGYREDLGMR